MVRIEPSPGSIPGLGRLVLATINRLSDDVYALILADPSGETATIEVTGSHPFMSQSRGWVRADALLTDEFVRTADSQAQVVSRLPLPGLHRVYNFTVCREHVYYVGGVGALAHNNCKFVSVDDVTVNGKPRPKPSATPDGVAETFKNPADAIGDLDGVAKYDSKGATDNDFWRKRGFTETEYWFDSKGTKWTIFKDPKTGLYSGAHPSTGYR